MNLASRNVIIYGASDYKSSLETLDLSSSSREYYSERRITGEIFQIKKSS